MTLVGQLDLRLPSKMFFFPTVLTKKQNLQTMQPKMVKQDYKIFTPKLLLGIV